MNVGHIELSEVLGILSSGDSRSYKYTFIVSDTLLGFQLPKENTTEHTFTDLPYIKCFILSTIMK